MKRTYRRVFAPRVPPNVGFGDEPQDPHDAAGWESFWRARLAPDGRDADPLFLAWMRAVRDRSGFEYRALIELLHHLNLKNVVVGGNGVSVLPYFLSHHGLDVIALDIAATATEYAATHPPDDEQWWWFYRITPERGRGRREFNVVDERARSEAVQQLKQHEGSPGVLTFKQADLFSVGIEPSSVDVIIAENVLDYYTADDRQRLASRFHEWLIPGGMVVIGSRLVTLGRGPRAEFDIEDDIRAAGFDIYRWKDLDVWRQMPAPFIEASKSGKTAIFRQHG